MNSKWTHYAAFVLLAALTSQASAQLAPVLNAYGYDIAPVSVLNLEVDDPVESRIASWITDVPWSGEIQQVQLQALAEQPLDFGTAHASIYSRPGKPSFRSKLDGPRDGGGGSSSAAAAPAAAPVQPIPAATPAPVAAPDIGVPTSDPVTAPLAPAPVTTPAPAPVAAPAPPTPVVDSHRAGVLETAIPASIRATPPSLKSTPAVDVVATPEIQILGSSETAEILQESNSVQTVEVQRRSPIDFDPRIRGFRAGQVYTQSDGAFWFPARQDLDSIMSKLDPSLIQDAIIVPGPYGLRYGPGFGFVNIITSPTPRFKDGHEVHARTAMTVRENGGQLYGRETVYGGGEDYGYIFNYGNRTGSDYESGDGSLIPASYHAQNFLGQVGIDSSEHTTWEFRYQRLDQTDTEYAGQFFDLGLLITDGYGLSYVNEDPDAIWERLTIDGWHNRTRFRGDTLNQSKRNFNVINRVESALGLPTTGSPPSFVGQTNGSQSATGFRLETLLGEDDDKQLRIGADYRRLVQRLNENFEVVSNDPFDTNLPRAQIDGPGVYSELTVPFDEFWLTTVGARVDWIDSTAAQSELRTNTSLPDFEANRDQSNTLGAFYLINDVQLARDWDVRFGFGHAQRAPTPVERYSDGLFLGIIQSGFSRVIGDPGLKKERLWQVDASTEFKIRETEFRISGFHSWVLDYITFTGNVINDPGGARLLRHINTDLATLTGAELYAERPLSDRLTGFGTFHVVDGRDRDIRKPLFGISPMEGRAGLRLVDGEDGSKWGVEFSARIVDDQDRLGGLRIGTTTVVDIIDLEVPTPGFTTFQIRGYWNVTDSLHVVAGIENLFDRNYLEHLSLRLPDDGAFTGTRVLEPGFAPYMTVEWTF